MKSCPGCNNLVDNNAAACTHCGMVLDQSLIARATGAPRQRVPTLAETAEPLRPSPPPRMDVRPTAPSAPPSGASAGRRGHTVFMPPGKQEGTAGPPAGMAAARRVIAVLVTYSWKPEGQVFPVLEGRNLIGRGEECDIRIAEDPMISSVNTHITFRQSFTIGDMVSMGGTDVNGEAVEEQFRPLHNLAQIRAGSTKFVFVVVDPALMGGKEANAGSAG